ncbi:MAG: hypothetical protein H6585_02560 [Flavobacteriales bacterium]|nr:hypothetical protein [Flavobacteriales bacterium]MCB9447211.1 hypothetical protein [Flavobacteriales bacterium]
MNFLMANNGIQLSVLNTANQQPVVYVGVSATLAFQLTNNTGSDIKMVAGGSASSFEIFMPLFYQLSDLQKMNIQLNDWSFAVNTTDVSLALTWQGTGSAVWADGQSLSFQVQTAESSASPTADSVTVLLNNFQGSLPPSVQAPLALNKNPQPGNAKLTDVLQVSLDSQGNVIVSPAGDPLQNTIFLNLKNISQQPIYQGGNMWTGNPVVNVTFVYGSTSGSLAPDNDKSAPVQGSAWNIRGGVAISQNNAWTVTNPGASSPNPHPLWTLQPANTNKQIIGTGDDANITFSFSDIISFTPPGHTQMMVQFSGFMKDETTAYDDMVFVLDIVKQQAPPTRGLLNFFSPTPIFQVTQPTADIQIPLRWTMFDVASVTLITALPGVEPVVYPYPNPAPIAYDQQEATLPGTVQSTAVTFTLQAYDGNGGYLNSLQFTAFLQANMFVDTRDGKVYPVVQVNNKIWMAANLDYDAPTGSGFYNGSSKYETPYGRLYTWEGSQYKIPAPWRLPSQEDWNDLFSAFASPAAAYAALITGGSNGFAAQLGGAIDNRGNSSQLGTYGMYWSSTPQGGSNAIYAGFSGNSQTVNAVANNPTNYMLSIRYVRDVS